MADWPREIVCRKLFGPEVENAELNLCRTFALLEHGCVLHTDFTGHRGPQTGMKMFEVALEELGLPKGWLLFFRDSEKVPSIQRVILASEHPPCHLLKRTESRLSQGARAKIQEMRPNKDDSTAEKFRAYQAQDIWMKQHAAEAFPGQASVGDCLTHPTKECQIAYRLTEGQDHQPLSVSMTGFSCTPFTPLGNQMKFAHPATKANQVFINAEANTKHNIKFIENSARYPKEHFQQEFGKGATCIHAIIDSAILGFPVTRNRFNGAAIDDATMVSLLPAGDVTEEFEAFFKCMPALDADFFAYCDTPENIADFRNSLATHPERATNGHPHVSDCLPPNEVVNFESYIKDFLDTGSHVGRDGCLVADVSQSKAHRRCGAWLPPIATSTTMVSLTADKNGGADAYFFTPSELAFAHGFPATPMSPEKYKDCSTFDLMALTQNKQKEGLGNGMHIVAMVAWYAFVFAHTLRRDSLPLARPNLDIVGFHGWPDDD